jgi:uncharacterized protein YbjT (DUF2867 family)
VVRGTTRQESRLGEISAAGAEAVLADPDRIATLAPALEHVGVVCVLLGSVDGGHEAAAVNGPRLEFLLGKMLDTTIRGVVYEGSGPVDPAVLAAGASLVEQVCSASRIPFAVLRSTFGDAAGGWDGWLDEAVAAVDGVLGVA